MGPIGQSNNPGGLPDFMRVRAQKGFRAVADGKFQVVNPGEVVEVSREVAVELRTNQKAVVTTEDLKRIPNYMPERKRKGRREEASAAK